MIDPITGEEILDPLASKPVTPSQGVTPTQDVLPEAQPITSPISRKALVESRGFEEAVPTQDRVMAFSRSGSSLAEERGFAPVKRDSAPIEFFQSLSGSLVDGIRASASTGQELGIIPSGIVKGIENWQDINQHLAVYEGAKFNSWSGFSSLAGQIGYTLPTIAVGAISSGLGVATKFTGAALNAVTRTGTGIAMWSQHFGDDVKFFRDEVGERPSNAMFLATLSSLAKTIPDVMLGADKRLVDAFGRGFGLNTLKAGGMNASLLEGLNKTARDGMIAKITGNFRPYASILKTVGKDVGTESATEMYQQWVDEFSRHVFRGDEFGSFSDYVTTGVGVVPSTLLLGGFGAYREHRNKMMIDDLRNPVTQKEVRTALQIFGKENMDIFGKEIERLQAQFLKVTTATGVTPEQSAKVAADIISAYALKSALKLDRHDGRRVLPQDFVANFSARIASRALTADEFVSLQKMPEDQAYDKLQEWGLLDDIDTVRKNSDAEDTAYLERELAKEMSVRIDSMWEPRDEQRMATWWGTQEGAKITTKVKDEAGVETEQVVDVPVQFVPDNEVRQLTLSTPSTMAEATTKGVIRLPEQVMSKESKVRALTNPAVVKVGDAYYAIRMLTDGTFGLVPTTARVTPEQIAARQQRSARIKSIIDMEKDLKPLREAAREEERKTALKNLARKLKQQKKMGEPSVQVEEGAAIVGGAEPASQRDIMLFAGRTIAPEGNTLPDATAKQAAAIKNVLTQEKERKAEQTLKSLANLPTIGKPEAQAVQPLEGKAPSESTKEPWEMSESEWNKAIDEAVVAIEKAQPATQEFRDRVDEIERLSAGIADGEGSGPNGEATYADVVAKAPLPTSRAPATTTSTDPEMAVRELWSMGNPIPASALQAADQAFLDREGTAPDETYAQEAIRREYVLEGDTYVYKGKPITKRVPMFMAVSPLRVKATRQQLVDDAIASSDWKDYYTRHQDMLNEIFGDDAGLFQELLSVTSQAASVLANVGLALKAYVQLKNGQPFDGYLPAVATNLQRVADKALTGGRKISTYQQANMGAEDAVVVDRHIARMLFGVDTPSKSQYDKAERIIREVGTRIGWTPREVQAALWAASIRKSGKEPVSYEQRLRQLKENGTLAERLGAIAERGSGGVGTGGVGGLASGRGVGDSEGGIAGSKPPQFMAQDAKEALEPGLYLASQKLAVFFATERLTPATIVHEYFHHVKALGLMPQSLQAALDKSFGNFTNMNDREEKEAQAFTRYLLEGELPPNADPKLAEAFSYMKKVSSAAYESLISSWELKPDVKAELDALFTFEVIDAEHQAVGEAVQAAMEYEKAVMFQKQDPVKRRFHALKSSFAKRQGMKEEGVREMLRAAGMKPYLNAKDDPRRLQQSDMNDEEIHAAIEYMEERDVGLSPAKEEAQAERARLLFGDEDIRSEAATITRSIASQPGADINYSDVHGGLAMTKKFLDGVRRTLKKGLMKSSTYWNLARILDGGNERGPVSNLLRRFVNQGEADKASMMDRIDKKLVDEYAALGDAAPNQQDLMQIVDLGPVQLEARKIAAAYMYHKGGWGAQLSERNVEFTPEVMAKLINWVQSKEGTKVRNFVEVQRKVLQEVLPKLKETANAVGVEMGNLGEWYLPFISENSFDQQEDWMNVLEAINPDRTVPGGQGLRKVSQVQTRADLSDIADPDIRLQRLQMMGRLDMRIDHIMSRYLESTANYIGKAEKVKGLLQVLRNPNIKAAVQRTHGDTLFIDGLIQNVVSEMYPGGRSTQLQTGERSLQYVRGATTLAMLGYRVRSVAVQPLALFQGWAAFATRPKDITRTLGYFFSGLNYGDGLGKAKKLINKEQLGGFEPYQEMIADWPQMRYRAFDPEYRDMVINDHPMFRSKFAKHSLDGMRLVDMAGVSALYKAAKQHQIDLLQPKIADGSMTEQQALKDAKEFALGVIDKTQNPSNLSQRSLFQKESEWMKAFNPFSGQRFVNWNYYIYDIALPIVKAVGEAKGVGGKTAAATKAIWNSKRQIAFAGALPALAMGALYRMRLPEDEEEIVADLITYPMATIPFVGQMAQSFVTGKYKTYSYDPTMIGALTRSSIRAADAVLKAGGGSWDELNFQDANAVRRTLTLISGTPDYPVQVLQNFIREMGWENAEEGNILLRVLAMPKEPVKEK